MDKYSIVIEILDHPEKYSSEQLSELLSDPETRDIYNLLCKTDSAIGARCNVDVDTEWKTFAGRHLVQPRVSVFRFFGSRAAAIAAIAFTSIAAVAIGIAVTVTVIDRNSETGNVRHDRTVVQKTDVAGLRNLETTDTANVVTGFIMYEDATLGEIMSAVAEVYGVKVKFVNKEAAGLHLYYKLDTTLSLDEVIEQLNIFEQINITHNGNTLNVD